jgi:predicted 3-demethylubiquinone-9 3-methyltransferase (glyoxalase superfamily)
MPKITPFLWFDGNLEEAMSFHASIFKNSKVSQVRRYGDAGPGPKGSVMTATFELEGQEFYGLNGGPPFKFTEAISIYVSCRTQREVDDSWSRLTAGGTPSRCGWLPPGRSAS